MQPAPPSLQILRPLRTQSNCARGASGPRNCNVAHRKCKRPPGFWTVAPRVGRRACRLHGARARLDSQPTTTGCTLPAHLGSITARSHAAGTDAAVCNAGARSRRTSWMVLSGRAGEARGIPRAVPSTRAAYACWHGCSLQPHRRSACDGELRRTGPRTRARRCFFGASAACHHGI